MKQKYIFLAILFLCVITGCNETITGIVVDAENGQPIEGAVILVEWTQAKGVPGMSYTDSYKVMEAVTDKEGKASIEGVSSPFVSASHVTVYKKGYVAWNNEFIFPDWKKRTDFKWSNNYVFKMEKFRLEYSHKKHVFFLNNSILLQGDLTHKKKIIKEFKWEEEK